MISRRRDKVCIKVEKKGVHFYAITRHRDVGRSANPEGQVPKWDVNVEFSKIQWGYHF